MTYGIWIGEVACIHDTENDSSCRTNPLPKVVFSDAKMNYVNFPNHGNNFDLEQEDKLLNIIQRLILRIDLMNTWIEWNPEFIVDKTLKKY